MEYFEQGLIAGPNETEEGFEERARYCLGIDKEIANIPFDPSCRADKEVIAKAHGTTRELYGIAPTWIPVFFSNYKLAPWHGGCAWIVQMTENSPISALFQLRNKFRNRDHVAGYSRKETIAHELSHVGRMAFEEPKFEEILAYRSSSHSFRRFFGPMVQSAKESMLFVIVILTLLLFDLYSLFGGYPIQLWPKFACLGVIAFAGLRVAFRQWQFSRCLKGLRPLVESLEEAGRLTYCLTDDEIIYFGKSNPEKILLYADTQKSPRWRQIHAIFSLKKL